MKRLSLLILPLLLIGLLHPMRAWALSEHYYDEDFIIASIVIADPSDIDMYSILGHACIRMQCPSEGLDLCFSYEGEPTRHPFFKFLMEDLHMGMFAIPANTYIQNYRQEKRGVYEYRLNLPLEVRRELWRILDQEYIKGPYLKYDYFYRGCAISSLRFIKRALKNQKLEYGPWGGRFNGTYRDIAYYSSIGNEWFHFVSTIVGTDKKIDGKVPNEDNVLVPMDLVHVLQNATLNGQPVLSNECNVLCEQKVHPYSNWFTPQLIAAFLLILALISLFVKRPYIDWLFLGIQTVFAFVMTYLLVFSSLPLTDWNWLIIPYNLLPAIAWHWRKYWAVPYAGLMFVWLIGFSIWPHFVIHTAHFLFVAAWILVLLKQSPKFEIIRQAISSKR